MPPEMTQCMLSGPSAPGTTYDYDYNGDEPIALTIAWVSSRHISRSTWHTAMASRPSEWGIFDAPFGINGISVIADNYLDDMPDDLINLCHLIVERGYDHVLIDEGGPTVQGLPIYQDWLEDDQG